MRQKFIGKLFAIVHGIQFVASRVCWCVCAWITVNCISNIRNIHLHWPRPLRTHKAHSDCLFVIKNSICSVLRKLVSVFIVVAAVIVAVVVIIVIVIVERVIVDAACTR